MSKPLFDALGLSELIHDGLAPACVVGEAAVVGSEDTRAVHCPIDGSRVCEIDLAGAAQLQQAVERSRRAFESWRRVPAPQRGELVRQIGLIARERKAELAEMITTEAGKSTDEAAGEVQEWIDVCDFAVGLSRQLYGLTIASERPDHRMMEQWHPLGPVGVITAFNFPMAPWAWNTMIALVCGDSVVWKPSPQAPLSALACHQVVQAAIGRVHEATPDLSAVVMGETEIGRALAGNLLLPLISATGSVPMGRAVAAQVAERLGRTVLELGGNNAAVVTPSADMALALKGVVFAAVGTAGQRCTTLRRLIAHQDIAGQLVQKLENTYAGLPIGDPRDGRNLVGPLISQHAYNAMQEALEASRQQGGELVCGGERITEGVPSGGVYVRPAIVRIAADAPIVQEETFAPILYVIEYNQLSDAIDINNGVPQGFSSAIFTRDMKEAERFVSAAGSDCGITNVNIGTSGAEIGGAFGGEKDTGGGRETGSDAWKNYMRRATNTINYGDALPLAQGIEFDI